MKTRWVIFIIVLLLVGIAVAADTELQDLAENTTIATTDVLYLVDDPGGTPASEKITALNLFDMIDTSAELYGILTDETGSGGGTPLAVFNFNPTLTGFTLAADADAGNFDLDSLDRLEFFDAGLYIDGGTDGVLLVSTDGTLELASGDWGISTTGVQTGMGAITSNGAFVTTANAITLGDTVAGDPVITFDSTNDGTITWEEDGQDFEISGDVEVAIDLRVAGAANIIGTTTLGTATSAAGDLTMYDAGTLTVYEDGDNFNITLACNSGEAVGLLTGGLDITGHLQTATFAATSTANIIGTTTLGTATSVAGNLTMYDAGTLTIYEDGDNFNVTIQCNAGEAVATLTGGLDVSGNLEGGTITEGGNAVPNVTDNLGVFGGTTSAELYGELSDETGSAAGTPLAMFNYNPTITLGPIITGADHNPAVAGEIRYDNTIAVMSGGGLRWFDDDSVRLLVDLEADPSDDDYVVAYDSAADGFYMKQDDDSGGATEWGDIGNPTNNGLKTITFDNAETSLFTGDNDAATSFFTLQNTDDDHTVGQLYLLDLDYSADDGDAEADYIKCQDFGGIVFSVQQDGETAMDGGVTSGGTVEGAAITEGGVGVPNLNETDWIGSAQMADEDHGDVEWSGGSALVHFVELYDAATSTYYVTMSDTDGAGASASVYSDTEFTYTEASGTVTATEFSGGGSNLTSVDAATGDSATAFFDAGSIEHEWGGLQADVSGYTGLIAITGVDTTAEIDDKSELEGQITDVSDFAEADGDIFTGDHDFGGADLELPQGQTPDTDGDVDLDFTDGSLVVQHGSAHAELGGSVDVVMGKLIHAFRATLAMPDLLQAEIDNWPLVSIRASEFPHGIVVTETYLLTSASSSYSLSIENWDDFDTINAGDPVIQVIATSTSTEVTEDAPTYATIAAGQIIQLNLDTDDIGWIYLEVQYYEPIA